jgi:hypothetical protein
MFRMLCQTSSQNSQLISQNEKLIIQNEQLSYQMTEVKELVKMHQAIPAQVLLRTPVLLHDARGRVLSFHLDFILSFEAFMAALRDHFQDLGAEKIERKEFALEDLARNQEIDFRLFWARLFKVRSLGLLLNLIADTHVTSQDNAWI